MLIGNSIVYLYHRIGLSLYNYARSSTGNSAPISPDTALDRINARGFYTRYVQGKKPFMLAETGASSDKNIPGKVMGVRAPHTTREEGDVKRSWMISLVEAMGQIQEFKAAVWFEEIKNEAVGPVELLRDFRITSTDLLTEIFLDSIETSKRQNVFVDGIVKREAYQCNGGLVFKP